MGKFEMQLPKEILKDFERIHGNVDKIFEGMTRAGAEVVYNNVLTNLPPELKGSEFKKCIGITKSYKTPSDDGINTKVIINGYFTTKRNESGTASKGAVFKSNVVVPAPLVANAFEYGTTERYTMGGAYRGKISKKPFFRKSFKKAQIETAMLEAQKKLSGGLLNE